jgi:hypothetical protein
VLKPSLVSQTTYASISGAIHELRSRSIVDGLMKYSSNMDNLQSLDEFEEEHAGRLERYVPPIDRERLATKDSFRTISNTAT